MRSVTTALLIGGAGFVGEWTAEVLRRAGARAIVLDNNAPGIGTAPEDSMVADVLKADVADIVESNAVDAVIHLAGTGLVPESLDEPLADLSRNTQTTVSVLESLRGLAQPPVFVFLSSAAVYGEGRVFPIDEEHPLEPVSPYGVSKLAAEHYVRLYARLYGLPTLSVRPFSLYGPRQRKLVIHDLLLRALSGEDPLVIDADPRVTRDFVFVEDAARALIAFARRAPAEGEAYNLASGRPVALEELAAELVRAAGLSTAVRFTGETRLGDPHRWEGDPGRARSLGIRTETTFEHGLRLTARWLSELPLATSRMAGGHG